MSRRTAVAAACLALLPLAGLIAGCSGGTADSGTPSAARLAEPSATAPSSFAPLPSPALESRALTGPHYRISIPAAWTDRTDTSSTAQIKPVVAEKPDAAAGRPIWVGIVVDDQAASDVYDQSLVLESSKRLAGATAITRTALAWPGAQRAVLIGWEETPRGGGSGPVRYLQLMAQVRQGLIVNAVAQAPTEDFGTAGLDRVLRSLVVTG